MVEINGWCFDFDAMYAHFSIDHRLDYFKNVTSSVELFQWVHIEIKVSPGTVMKWNTTTNSWEEFFGDGQRQYNWQVWRTHSDWLADKEIEKVLNGPTCG